jgi:acyl-CoA thioesterase-1
VKRRRLLAGLLLSLLAACGKRAARFSPLPPGTTALFLGDSLTAGTGSSAAEAFPSLIAAKTGWQVINAGVPGDTSAGARERLPELLAEHRPAVVILTIGGNDFLRKLPMEQTQANIAAMLASINAAGAIPVLVSVPQPSLLGAASGSLRDAPLYAELAGQHRAALLPDAIAAVLGDNRLKTDPVHPNADGQAQLAERLLALLREARLYGG